jgi:hypothetical protein
MSELGLVSVGGAERTRHVPRGEEYTQKCREHQFVASAVLRQSLRSV